VTTTKVDINDILTVSGLTMAFTGLWWIYPPSALIVTGAILFWAGTKPPGKAVK